MITELCEAENLQLRARELALKITASAPLGVQAALKSSKLARMQGDKAALSEVFVAISVPLFAYLPLNLAVRLSINERMPSATSSLFITALMSTNTSNKSSLS